MKNEQNAPKIRFKGFTDAWELRKLSLSFDILQNNTLSRSELSIENGAARNVHYGDILVKYGEVLDLKTEELPFIQSSQTVDKLKGSFLQNGDIIMADTAEDETAGKCTEIANLDNMNVLAGLHTIPLRPKQKYAVGYLGYYMNSGSFHDKLLPLMQGTKVTSISKSALQGMSILRPADLEEQRQIGAYFRTLDHLITLHQRKGKAAVSGCFLNCSSLEKSSAQSRTLELFGQTSNQEIKYIIDGLSILGGKLRNFCVKLIILLSYTRINDIAKYHISRNTECVHNIN